MVKIADCVEQGQTILIVNPKTTRIYGAIHAGTTVQNADPNTQYVQVVESLDEVNNWIAQGAFYKDGAIYKGMTTNDLNVLATAEQEFKIRIQFPEYASTTLNVYLYKEEELIWDESYTATGEVYDLKLTAPKEIGQYTLKIISEEYGRLSITIVIPGEVPKLVNEQVPELTEEEKSQIEVLKPFVNSVKASMNIQEADLDKLINDSEFDTLANELSQLSDAQKKKIIEMIIARIKKLY
jgi:hypothetical protein